MPSKIPLLALAFILLLSACAPAQLTSPTLPASPSHLPASDLLASTETPAPLPASPLSAAATEAVSLADALLSATPAATSTPRPILPVATPDSLKGFHLAVWNASRFGRMLTNLDAFTAALPAGSPQLCTALAALYEAVLEAQMRFPGNKQVPQWQAQAAQYQAGLAGCPSSTPGSLEADLALAQQTLLASGDPKPVRDHLAQLFIRAKGPDASRQALAYLLGLAYELSGDTAKAADTYLWLWLAYPESPYTYPAYFKLESP